MRESKIFTRWERLRKLLRLLVGRRKRKRFTLPEDSTINTNIQSLKEETGGVGKAVLPPESARLEPLSDSSDLLASLNKFRLSTAASRWENVVRVEAFSHHYRGRIDLTLISLLG